MIQSLWVYFSCRRSDQSRTKGNMDKGKIRREKGKKPQIYFQLFSFWKVHNIALWIFEYITISVFFGFVCHEVLTCRLSRTVGVEISGTCPLTFGEVITVSFVIFIVRKVSCRVSDSCIVELLVILLVCPWFWFSRWTMGVGLVFLGGKTHRCRTSLLSRCCVVLPLELLLGEVTWAVVKSEVAGIWVLPLKGDDGLVFLHVQHFRVKCGH
jgi:hypothetical protein